MTTQNAMDRIAAAPAPVVIPALGIPTAMAQARDNARRANPQAAEAAAGVQLAWDAPAQDSPSATGCEVLRRRPQKGAASRSWGPVRAAPTEPSSTTPSTTSGPGPASTVGLFTQGVTRTGPWRISQSPAAQSHPPEPLYVATSLPPRRRAQ